MEVIPVFLTTFHVFWIQITYSSLHVGSDASWWLSCQFDTILQNTDWEVVFRHTGQEQSEVRMDILVVLLDFLNEYFQVRHPTLAQVAILE